MIWGWNGLIIFALNLTIFFLELKYCDNNRWNSLSILVQFYINTVLWIYIGIIFGLYWLIKFVYLGIAWKCPKFYCKFTNVYK